MIAASIGPQPAASSIFESSFQTMGKMYAGARVFSDKCVRPAFWFTAQKTGVLWNYSKPVLSQAVVAAQTRLGGAIVCMALAIPTFYLAGLAERNSLLAISLLATGTLLAFGAVYLLHISETIPALISVL